MIHAFPRRLSCLQKGSSPAFPPCKRTYSTYLAHSRIHPLSLPPFNTMLQTTYQLPILLLALLCPIANAEIPPIAKRAACEEKSWKPDDGKAEYTRPANDTQILVRGISGPVSLQITGPRLQSFTASMDISFADAASLAWASISPRRCRTRACLRSLCRRARTATGGLLRTCCARQVSVLCYKVRFGAG